MTQADFIPLIEQELAVLGTAYDRAALLEFMGSAWPLIEEEPDALHWAREFQAGFQLACEAPEAPAGAW